MLDRSKTAPVTELADSIALSRPGSSDPRPNSAKGSPTLWPEVACVDPGPIILWPHGANNRLGVGQLIQHFGQLGPNFVQDGPMFD